MCQHHAHVLCVGLCTSVCLESAAMFAPPSSLIEADKQAAEAAEGVISSSYLLSFHFYSPSTFTACTAVSLCNAVPCLLHSYCALNLYLSVPWHAWLHCMLHTVLFIWCIFLYYTHCSWCSPWHGTCVAIGTWGKLFLCRHVAFLTTVFLCVSGHLPSPESTPEFAVPQPKL